jgi:cell fate regulator YaaT (PSP1 superfamily)
VSHLIEVAFRGNRKEFFQWTGDTIPPLKAGVIVEADRGEDFGRVHATGELAEVRCNGCAHGCGSAPPPRAALRLATPEDAAAEKALDAENESARRKAMERVKANGLVMKLTDAEWQWDRRKLTFYFTAERRVDFRGLVRDLAALFRTRIELKQIGVRDEAKRLSGIGRCGREYCSASWLPDLRPVNLGVAKDQKLSLNPQQISGACGRLMCCLRYEHEFYVQSRRRFPKEGKILQTGWARRRCSPATSSTSVSRCARRKATRASSRSRTCGRRWVGSATRWESATMAPRTTAATATISRWSRPRGARSSAAPRAGTPRGERRPADAHGARRRVGCAERDRGRVPRAGSRRAGARADPDAGGVPPVAAAPVADGADGEDTTEGPAATEGGEPRRKRRRGRRGGRRLRAAEQRRAGEAGHAGDGDAGDGMDGGADDSDDDDLPPSDLR